ncbi:MAG: sigma-54-dependent Fis family transcriptional regulator [Planctomycetia bacterium]|nr:sigma-54-dependent Fis family transcriptional regulator [Planctomycetia bacterium]
MPISALLFTCDAPLAEQFAEVLPESLSWHVVPEAAQLLADVRSHAPQAVVFDFRTVPGGGHAEAGLLDLLSQLPGDRKLIVLASGECPEPLERQMACSAAVIVREPLDVETMTALLLPVVPDEPVSITVKPVAPASDPVADDADPAYVLTGLTRRFETNCPRLRMMLADLEVAARHDVTVLLIGETGSGKTYLAKLIHEISLRRSEPFLPVACGALPSELIESEMFGHAKGAFTSAHADKDGKFVAAGRGTILLDEIDVLGPEQQVKLLRVMESGEFEPVGSNRTMKSEARLIVASNLDLQPLVEQKKFRPDLYYRLNMLKFEIPPLRARRSDIIPLAKRFIREQAARHQVQIARIDNGLFSALVNYPWPGNVRELEHVIQRAVIYCRDGVLSDRHLPGHVVACVPGPSQEGGPQFDRFIEADFVRGSLGRQVAVSERDIIEQTLFQNNHSRTNTAKALGISRVTLYNKMKKYGITK